MSRTLFLFAADLERNAAFPDGVPAELLTEVCGVGLVDAALGTAKAIEKHTPAEIVFLGTCGVHPHSGLEIGAILIANEVALGSGDVASGQMRIPSLIPAFLKCDELFSEQLVHLFSEDGQENVGRVSSTLGITEDDRLAIELERFDNSLAENLEAYSVVRAAGHIPTGIVLCATNIVGGGGGRDWAQNYKECMRALGARIR